MATPPAPPAKESGDEPTAATRHLCAGPYVDEHFRDLVIDKVCTSPHRRVAPSYGFDIVPVMRHAWRAAALTVVLRVTLLGSVIAPACAGALPASVLVACGLALLWLLRLALLIHRGDREPRTDRRPGHRSKERQYRHRRRIQRFLPRRQSEKSRALQHIGGIALGLATTGLAIGFVHPHQAATALRLGAAIVLVCLAVGKCVSCSSTGSFGRRPCAPATCLPGSGWLTFSRGTCTPCTAAPATVRTRSRPTTT